jgi:uncharacterized membrane protein
VNEVRRAVDIDRPAAAVWAVLEDVRRLPELSPSTVEVVGPERLERPGQTFTQTVTLAGKRFTSEWEVLEIDPGRRLVIQGSVLPGTRYRMAEAIEDLGPGRSRFTLTMTYKLPFGPLGKLAAKLGAERRAVDEAEQVLVGVARLAGDDDAVPAAIPFR